MSKVFNKFNISNIPTDSMLLLGIIKSLKHSIQKRNHYFHNRLTFEVDFVDTDAKRKNMLILVHFNPGNFSAALYRQIIEYLGVEHATQIPELQPVIRLYTDGATVKFKKIGKDTPMFNFGDHITYTIY